MSVHMFEYYTDRLGIKKKKYREKKRKKPYTLDVSDTSIL